MKKFIYFILFLIVLIFIASFFADRLIKSGIENTATELTGTNVNVESVSVSIFSGKGAINGLTIKNPEGFSDNSLITVGEILFESDITTLFSDEIILNQVSITDSNIRVEQKLPDNNLYTIVSNIESKSSREDSDKSLYIERLVMQNSTVELYTSIGGETEESVMLETIELESLGRDGQDDLYQVIEVIAKEIASEAAQGALRSGGEQLRDAIRNLFDN